MRAQRSRHMAIPMPPPMQSVARPFFHVAALHLVEQRRQHARSRGADRMPDRDGAAVDVHDRRVPAHVLVDRERLGREGFVGLDELDVLDLPAGFSSALREAGIGPDPMMAGSTPAVAQEAIRARGFRPRVSASSAVISTTAAAPSLRPEALPAVTVPVLREGGLQLSPCPRPSRRARIYSSWSTTTSPLRLLTVIGTISSLNLPAFWAASALFWDLVAKLVLLLARSAATCRRCSRRCCPCGSR